MKSQMKVMSLELVMTLLLDLIFVKMVKSRIQEESVKQPTNSALPRKKTEKPEARNQDDQEILGNISKADIVFNFKY